jgi:DNA-binding MarR family transcriptional regulator
MEEAGLVEERPTPHGDRRRTFALLPAGRLALEAEARRITHLAGVVRATRLVTGDGW